MARRPLRTIKVCSHCGSGFDAFKALDARGRYCSPECLGAAREEHRRPRGEEDEAEASAMMPGSSTTS